MIQGLQRMLEVQAPDASVELVETHISYVLLAGVHAFKVKKALKLAFLDFSTLARRRHYCVEELRLNRRFAPELYLALLDITGSPQQPAFGGDGPVLDHAVHMRAFPQHALWDRLVRNGGVLPRHIDALAERVARFHARAAVSGEDTGYGRADRVRAPMRDNLDALDAAPPEQVPREAIAALRRWEACAYGQLAPVFDARQRAGRVRECHGDLHLGNLAMIDDGPVPFDGLEFDPALSWTDVMSDVAFVTMDLQQHGCTDLANRFVDAYLEHSGDYDGARVLRYYLVHRALVRAKVALLRAGQSGVGSGLQRGSGGDAAASGGAKPGLEAGAATQARIGAEAAGEGAAAHGVEGGAQDGSGAGNQGVRSYLALALQLSAPPRPLLMATHGYSGSGKTSFTQVLLEATGAVRVRADVERKRLHGLAAGARSGSAVGAGLYTDDADARTDAALLQAAAALVAGGVSVIVDATFLRRKRRAPLRALAHALGVGFVWLDFRADEDTLRERVAARARHSAQGPDDASEADLAVLEHQFAVAEPLSPDELEETFVFDAATPLDPPAVGAAWRPLLDRLDTLRR